MLFSVVIFLAKVFFKNNIAVPLNMQDFRLMDVYDHKEVRSQHPAHPFRMSARDLARFALLFLNNGDWKRKQIISSDWIEESILPHSKLSENDIGEGDYGYLWWVSVMTDLRIWVCIMRPD